MAAYFKVPRPVVRTMAVLCFVAAAFGMWLGARSLPTETDVIAAGAAIYEDETGRSAIECVGVPGTGLVWIAVRCGSEPSTRVYLFSRQGVLMAPEGEPSA